MKKCLMYVALLTSFTTYANTSFNGDYTIVYDSSLDGVVEPSSLNQLTFSGTSGHFIASSEVPNLLSGFTYSNETLISFKLSNGDGSSTSFYTGKLETTGIYKGTWFSSDGSSGDWQIDNLVQNDYQNCKQILDAGRSLGDGLYNVTVEGGSKVTVYCDMTSDEGGWTLVGTYPKTAQGGISRISQYPSVPETAPNDPSNLWLYPWSLSHFSDAKEQIACSTANCSNGKSVYGFNFSESELNDVRFTWGYEDSAENMPQISDTPSCFTGYNDTNSLQACTSASYLANTSETTAIGWQLDAFGTTHCWVARGTYNPSAMGSSRCVSGRAGGEPNGTRWALLWMR